MNTTTNWIIAGASICVNVIALGTAIGVMRSSLVSLKEDVDRMYKHIFNGLTGRINDIYSQLHVLQAIFDERTRKLG